MGTGLRQDSRAAEAIFLLAEDITRLPLRQLCDQGPLSELTRTSIAQVAVVTVSLAALAAVEETLGERVAARAVAGHSVGELAAYCCAGALDAETTLRLVHRRGELMERDSAAADGTMVAVLNLDADTLQAICGAASRRTGGSVEVANLNAPGQVVLSGDRAAIALASELAAAAGARRVIPLNVGGPFHSRYMKLAGHEFHGLVAEARFHEPHTPIVLNTTAASTTNPDELRGELSQQITSPVRWEESLHTLAEMGCATFVELGPGQILTGLVRRTIPDARVLAAGTPETVESVAGLFARVPSR
jgi:[acyl-carrier-protein] S-malonyltransferase